MSKRIKPFHVEWECPIEEMMAGNKLRTQSLFCEQIQWPQLEKGFLPVYTLLDTDKEYRIPDVHPTRGGEVVLLPSAYLIYMTCVDEYEAAIKLLGSWKHWTRIVDQRWMKKVWMRHPGIDAWREDMRMRDLSKAKKLLEQAAEDGNVPAAKALYDQSKGTKKKDVGRPKKEEPVVDDTEEIDSLYKNVIGLSASKGS